VRAPAAAWVRVSQRGRWHQVERTSPRGAYYTACGRSLASRAVQGRIEAGEPDYEARCDKCRAA
jgi:hypothetical protein